MLFIELVSRIPAVVRRISDLAGESGDVAWGEIMEVFAENGTDELSHQIEKKEVLQVCWETINTSRGD